MAVVVTEDSTRFDSYVYEFRASTVAMPDGGFAVLWSDINIGMRLQIFDADGTLKYNVAGEQPDPSSGSYYYEYPSIAVLDDGKLALSWTSLNSDHGTILAFVTQVVDPETLTPVADPANPGAPETLDDNSVVVGGGGIQDLYSNTTSLGNGGFVTVWQEMDFNSDFNTKMQVFDATGAPLLSQPLKLDITPADSTDGASVTALSNGGFVVTWIENDGFSNHFMTQAFDAEGSASGAAAQSDSAGIYAGQFPSTVALANGGFVTAWTADSSSDGDTDAFIRLFDNDGSALTVARLANVDDLDSQTVTGMTALADGGFVVGWTSCGCSGSSAALRVFNADGSVRTAEIPVDIGAYPSVQTLADGGFVVAWTFTDSSSHDLLTVEAFNADGSVRYSGTEPISDAGNVYVRNSVLTLAPQITVLEDGSVVVEVAGNDYAYYSRVFHFSNEAPTAADATFTILEDTPRTLAASDFGFADSDGGTLGHVIIDSLPGTGTLTLDGVAVTTSQAISIADIDDGKLVWTPPADDNGASLGSFSFSVQDSGGVKHGGHDTSSSHVLTFDVTAVNDAPTSADATITAIEDTAYTFSLATFAYDDVEGDTFTGVVISALPSGTLTLNGVAVNAGEVISPADIAAGKLVWTPPADGNGAGLTTLQFKVQDDGGTADGGHDTSAVRMLTFDVTAVNDAPAGADATVTAVEDTAYTFTLTNFALNDIDGDSLANVIINALPSGMLMLSGIAVSAGQTISSPDIAAGKLVWTPPADDNGAGLTTLQFKVQDDGGTVNGGHDTSAVHMLTFDVTAINDAPASGDATVTVVEDTAYTFTLANFALVDNDGNTLANVIIDDLPSGTLKLNGVAVTAGQAISSADITAGKLVWTPPADANGADLTTLQFKVQDDGGTAHGGHDTSTVHTLTFDVTAVDDAPSTIGLSISAIDENSPAGAVVGTLSAVDPDQGDTQSFAVDDPTGTFVLSGNTIVLAAGKSLDFENKTSYSIDVTVSDGDGLTHTETLTIGVNDVNEAPTNIGISTSAIDENSAAGTVVGTLSATDPDTGDTRTFSIDDPTGTFTLSGDTIVLASGKSLDFETESSYSVEVTVTDSGGLKRIQTFTIAVNDVDEAPTAVTLSANTIAENSVAGTVVGTLSATDPDTGDTHAFSIVDPSGTFSIEGDQIVLAAGKKIDFETQASYSVDVTVTDGGGLTHMQALTIDITDVREAIVGTPEDDKLHGTANADVIKGLAGNDILHGKGGGDTLSGGKGFDEASYASAHEGVVVDMAKLGRNTGDAAGDRYIGIEAIVGSKFGDTLIGNGKANTLDGGKGDDTLTGRGGSDHFVFARKHGDDTITDFHAKGAQHDVIDLSHAAGIDGFKDLLKHHIQDTGNELTISAKDGSTLVLEHVRHIADLTQADFLF